MSDFDRYSLTIARWLTHVYDADNPAENYTTPGDVTSIVLHRGWIREVLHRSETSADLGVRMSVAPY